MTKRLLVINPNSSQEMTLSIEKTINSYNKNSRVDVVCLDQAPQSLESYYDYQISSYEMIKMLQQNEKKYDGILVSCFGDPGIYSLKEMYAKPVIGIAEASMSAAILVGRKFSIIAASHKATFMMNDLVFQYGLMDRLASVRTLNTNVLDIEENKNNFVSKLLSVVDQCINDGADSVIFGCASMTGLKDKIEEKVPIPIIDPIAIGYKLLEMMVETHLTISKHGSYSFPPNGLMDIQ